VTVYWVIFGIFALGALLTDPDPDRERQSSHFLLFASIVFLTLFVGLRWKIGPDWNNYLGMYREMQSVSITQAMRMIDPGFRVIIPLLHGFDAPFFVLNLISASIFCFGLARFAASLRNPWLAVLVAIPYLVIVIAMSALRQAAAIGFIFLALREMGTKALWKSILWVLVASLFHASAIIVAIIVALSYSRNRLQSVLMAIIAAWPAYYVLAGTFDSYLWRYGHRTIDSGGVVFRVAMNAVPALILLARGTRHFSPPGEEAFWRNLAILSLALAPALLFVTSTTSIDRLSLYAVPLQMLVLSRVPDLFSARESPSLFPKLGVIGYCAVTLIVFFTLGTHARYYIPYRMVELWSA
jgi:hypothetical protein